MTEPLTLAQRLNGRDIYECANQLEGYVDSGTPERLAQFLLREGKAASDLADEVHRLRAANKALTEDAEMLREVKHSSHWKARAIEAENDRDRYIEGKVLAEAQRDAAEAKLAKVEETLADPVAVRANILAGKIAIPDDLVWLHHTNGPVAAISAELAEARAEIERLTPLAVAYDYLEPPAGREMAEAKLEEALKGIGDPDLISMSGDMVRLHYEDLDAAQSAFDWLEAFLASKEASQ